MNENGKASILIVNGGVNPQYGKWIHFCLNKIFQTTEWPDYHIYIWNNNIDDKIVIDYLKNLRRATYIEADPLEKLAHPHAVPLQKLYEYALNDKSKYIVTLDIDSHPLKKGWLKNLIFSLNDQEVLAGIWRNELRKAIKPYIHPSCLCTTVDFIENNNLRFDYIPPATDHKIGDTLSTFTDKAYQLGLDTFKLYRTNKNNFHRLMGGIYGGIIYHHGAGSRNRIRFWDESQSVSNFKRNRKIADLSAELLFCHYENYINWLNGNDVDKDFEKKIRKLLKNKKDDRIIIERIRNLALRYLTFFKN